MSMQLSTTVRNGMLDAIETIIGTSGVLKVYTGPAPENCAAASSGTVLATVQLPSDWMAAADSGATGNLAITGQANITLDNILSSATAALAISAQSSATLENITSSGVIQSTSRAGQGNITLDAITSTSSGTIALFPHILLIAAVRVFSFTPADTRTFSFIPDTRPFQTTPLQLRTFAMTPGERVFAFTPEDDR